MIDDPDLAKGADAEHDLIQLGVVINGVDVGPVVGTFALFGDVDLLRGEGAALRAVRGLSGEGGGVRPGRCC